VLGAGRSNVPTDQLISSAPFDASVKEAQRSFDIVVIDTSPLLPVVDARYIAHYADAVVMPVRYATTSQADLRSAVQSLTEAMNPEADFYTVLSHQQFQQAAYKYDGYYLGYGGGVDKEA
jgi:cellulose biosynthesis protein BcsQ